ncbi:hypothetical protein BC828DRAFT_261209 [Blastocladiella britannica]|nr:hypothetical protein BC828DRAFT_261209 [Blastocladiella britannica]
MMSAAYPHVVRATPSSPAATGAHGNGGGGTVVVGIGGGSGPPPPPPSSRPRPATNATSTSTASAAPGFMRATKASAALHGHARGGNPLDRSPSTSSSTSATPSSSSRGATRSRTPSGRSVSLPRPSGSSSPMSSSATPPPAVPALPPALLHNASAVPATTTDPLPPSSLATSEEVPCASCAAHYRASPPPGMPPLAWTTGAPKLARHLLDVHIANDALRALVAELEEKVETQGAVIARMERAGYSAANSGGVVPVESFPAPADERGTVFTPRPRGWDTPISEDIVMDHQMLLTRMCDRTHAMLDAAQRAVLRARGDMALVTDADLEDDDGAAAAAAAESSDPDVQQQHGRSSEASSLHSTASPAGDSPTTPRRSRVLSVTSMSSLASGGGSAGVPVVVGELDAAEVHALVKSLAYHVHLLDTVPPPPPLSPPPPPQQLSPVSSSSFAGLPGLAAAVTRRTSSSAGSATGKPAAAGRGGGNGTPLLRTPSGFGVLGLAALLDRPLSSSPAASLTGNGSPPTGAANAADALAASMRRHAAEHAAVVQGCKDAVLSLARVAGVDMREVDEMVADAARWNLEGGAAGVGMTRARLPSTSSSLSSVWSLRSGGFAPVREEDVDVGGRDQRHRARTGVTRRPGDRDDQDDDMEMVDVLSDADSTRSNYSRTSVRSWPSSIGDGPVRTATTGGGSHVSRASTAISPQSAGSHLAAGTAAAAAAAHEHEHGGNDGDEKELDDSALLEPPMYHPNQSLEEKYKAHLAHQRALDRAADRASAAKRASTIPHGLHGTGAHLGHHGHRVSASVAVHHHPHHHSQHSPHGSLARTPSTASAPPSRPTPRVGGGGSVVGSPPMLPPRSPMSAVSGPPAISVHSAGGDGSSSLSWSATHTAPPVLLTRPGGVGGGAVRVKSASVVGVEDDEAGSSSDPSRTRGSNGGVRGAIAARAVKVRTWMG